MNEDAAAIAIHLAVVMALGCVIAYFCHWVGWKEEGLTFGVARMVTGVVALSILFFGLRALAATIIPLEEAGFTVILRMLYLSLLTNCFLVIVALQSRHSVWREWARKLLTSP